MLQSSTYHFFGTPVFSARTDGRYFSIYLTILPIYHHQNHGKAYRCQPADLQVPRLSTTNYKLWMRAYH